MRTPLIAAALLLVAVAPASAQLVISANDTKMVLVNGVGTVLREDPTDSITIHRFGPEGLAPVAQLAVPTSVVGPPLSVAITPDERLALVTAAMLKDPADATKQVPGNFMTVIDLAATPPRVLGRVETGLGPAGLSINRAGTLALVANRNAGTVSVYRIAGQAVTPIETVRIGPADSGVSHVAFTPDGRRALITRDNDSTLSVLAIDGEKVTVANRDFAAGLRPYGMAITRDGQYAVVANIGRGLGDADTVSLVDLRREPWRVTQTMTVGQTPEGIMVSPDGAWVGVVVMNGSNKPPGSPFLNANGKLVLLRLANGVLSTGFEAPIGTWSQGVAFSADSRMVVTQDMVEKRLLVFRIGEGGVTQAQSVAIPGGGAAIRTAER
jgi:DNA-binding beta-propeller fold protein YncE